MQFFGVFKFINYLATLLQLEFTYVIEMSCYHSLIFGQMHILRADNLLNSSRDCTRNLEVKQLGM